MHADPRFDHDDDLADPAPAAVIEVCFDVEGGFLARDHRRDLADALAAALPWWAEAPLASMLRLNLPAGGGALVPLSRRTRLTLRVPRERADEAEALAGRTLEVGGQPLALARARRRELLPFGTLYAHLVVFDADDDAGFVRAAQAGLTALGVVCRAISGREQVADAGALHGRSLMLDGLAPAHALRVLERGLGLHRELGCGVFVPHKSAAAVGAPA